MSNRALTYGGLLAAGGVGYYLYNAGGDPKAAEKRAEHDAARLSTSIKDTLPGRGKEARTEAERLKEDARSAIQTYSNDAQKRASDLSAEAQKKYNELSSEARREADKVDKTVQQYSADASKQFEDAKKTTGTQLQGAVDTFDKKVEEGAAKAKSGISSWFGGK